MFKGKKAQLELFEADGEPAPGLVAEPEKEGGLFPEVGDPANEDDPEDENGGYVSNGADIANRPGGISICNR